MPRRARLVLPNVPLHLIQRGNNRQACFFADADYRVYLAWLAEHADANGCRVHAYVLMSNHVHLLISVDEAGSPGALMKALGQQYVQYVNRRYGRSGTLWEGRFRSCLIQQEMYLLICQRYIELNPVRAGMVQEPAQYQWSSYRGNAEGCADPILRPHPLYSGMAEDAGERQRVYRSLFDDALAPERVNALRKATNGNFALGDLAFTEQAAAALGRRVVPDTPGRPPKTK
ncbi:putative transposase [Janthinobacterium sp. CG_23.3]|uniref:transposase n=1 Tax=unclassified Janthinobacterium TaxID=2610881 RepID=UPI00034C351D|nr:MULTISPECIES: transposase [unclassified Janthinobacterium]MEC5163723.1 putative transposase [Janthinobacterium sp. CG_S6]